MNDFLKDKQRELNNSLKGLTDSLNLVNEQIKGIKDVLPKEQREEVERLLKDDDTIKEFKKRAEGFKFDL